MSVSSMANIAFARRADVEPEGEGLDTLDKVAEAKGQQAGTGSGVTSAVSAIAAYIPTEIVTIYVAVVATLGVTVPSGAIAGTTQPAGMITTTPIAVYLVFIILTPLVVWGLYASRAISAGRRLPRTPRSWPKWEMTAATLAFAAWGAALPSSPLGDFEWFRPALAGVVALVLSMLIGVFAPIFSSKPLANK